VTSIAAGDYAGMVLLRDGAVLDWGFNGRGDLGTGVPTTTGCRCLSSPARVKGLTRVVAIAHGSYDGYALLANRTLMDWGYNDAGELGNGGVATAGCFCVPSAKAVQGLTDVVQIAAGYEYAVALLGSGSARAWGWNPNGQVGNGTASPATGCQCVRNPVAVTGLSGVSAVADGGQHALALRVNGTLEAWGWNQDGQLGNGSTSTTGCVCVPSAAPVDGLGGATAVAGGYFHSLAVAGPSQRLSVARAGAGSGVVGGESIVCPATCAHRYPQGTYVALRAVPAGKTRFAGFTGACRGTGPCRVRLDADRTVVATFGPPKGTRLTAAAIHPKQHSASF
jgi:alpha-tubulin suppressor-like RCC1 family protein